MKKLEIPVAYRDRLAAAAARRGDGTSVDAFALDLIERGLRVYEEGAPARGSLAERLAVVVEEQGYSGSEELVDHLLERGLGAYESADTDPERLAARLRGLGYID